MSPDIVHVITLRIITDLTITSVAMNWKIMYEAEPGLGFIMKSANTYRNEEGKNGLNGDSQE